MNKGGISMKFKELLEKVTKEDIVKYFSEQYSEEGYIEDYLKLYESLKNREMEESNIDLFLVWQKDYFDEKEYISVLGYDSKENQHYALDFMNREKWLGSGIIEKSLFEFGVVTFVCECMHEMTFISFDENKIEEERNILNERVKEIENGTAKFLTSEEFFASLQESLGDVVVHEVEEIEPDEIRKEKINRLYEFNNGEIKRILEK